ncbi:hypothetical protein F4819DRAFT_488538 [Hypoxylon fuscum]|nr:hypothetical protein F4819DRAFT_488538 [Hypoxylon fuscum]
MAHQTNPYPYCLGELEESGYVHDIKLRWQASAIGQKLETSVGNMGETRELLKAFTEQMLYMAAHRLGAKNVKIIGPPHVFTKDSATGKMTGEPHEHVTGELSGGVFSGKVHVYTHGPWDNKEVIGEGVVRKGSKTPDPTVSLGWYPLSTVSGGATSYEYPATSSSAAYGTNDGSNYATTSSSYEYPATSSSAAYGTNDGFNYATTSSSYTTTVATTDTAAAESGYTAWQLCDDGHNYARQNLSTGAWDVIVPANILDTYFQNQSSEPYTQRQQPCTLNNYTVYSINVSSISDVQAGIAFASGNSIRLSIKISATTTIDFVDEHIGDIAYNSTAVRLGASVVTEDPLSAATTQGVRVITGTCDKVGVAGGYMADGGHGSLTSPAGRTPGIAMPDAGAQAAVIWGAYINSGISEAELAETGYLECHGTGI